MNLLLLKKRITNTQIIIITNIIIGILYVCLTNINDTFLLYDYFTNFIISCNKQLYLFNTIGYILTICLLGSSFLGLPMIILCNYARTIQIFFTLKYMLDHINNNIYIYIIELIIEFLITIILTSLALKISFSTTSITFFKNKTFRLKYILNMYLNNLIILLLLTGLSLWIRLYLV